MGERHLQLEKDGPPRLTLMWTGTWKDIEVQLDGQVLGERIPDFEALKQGRYFSLPDGRALFVQFVLNRHGRSGLKITADGADLPGLVEDPRKLIRNAAIILWVVAGLNLLAGLIMRSAKWSGHGGSIFTSGWIQLGIGAVLAVLGWFVLKRRSRLAIALGLAIQVVDGVLSTALIASTNLIFVEYAIYVRIPIIIALVKAYSSVAKVYKLEREELVAAFR